jgi:hypothetical protein
VCIGAAATEGAAENDHIRFRKLKKQISQEGAEEAEDSN